MRKLLYLFAILIIVSCSKKQDSTKGILPPDQMAIIIAEIYHAEHKATNVGLRYDSSKKVLKHYELKIFEQYGTTDSVYKESFKYYLENPQALETVYDIVIDTLSLREQVQTATKKSN